MNLPTLEDFEASQSDFKARTAKLVAELHLKADRMEGLNERERQAIHDSIDTSNALLAKQHAHLSAKAKELIIDDQSE